MTKLSLGLTAEHPSPIPPHEKNGTYDVQYQEEGAMEILDSDDDGNEFPAKAGWYFKQFVPAPFSKGDWMGVDGWFGPYPSTDAMPDHVRANFTDVGLRS